MGITRMERLRRTAAAIIIDQLAGLTDEPPTPTGIRRWIFNSYGLKSVPRWDMTPEEGGLLSYQTDGATIFYSAALMPAKLMRVLIHELAEYMQRREQGGLFDLVPGFQATYTGADCMTDAHHDVATRVEAHFTRVLSLDRGPSSLGAAAMLRIFQGPGCPDRYTYEQGIPDMARVDALADACI